MVLLFFLGVTPNTVRIRSRPCDRRHLIVPTGGDAVSYDAVRLLLEAAERAGSLDADAIRQQLLATEQYAGATRIASYNENRYPTKSAVIMTIENGEKKFYQQVDP